MNFLKCVLAFYLLVFLLGTSCKHDPVVSPDKSSCDSTNVSFQKSVLPILTSHCSSCHGSSIATHGIILDNYQNVKIFALEGSLYGAIIRNGEYAPMPYNAPKLDVCSIAIIHHWIIEGAKNN